MIKDSATATTNLPAREAGELLLTPKMYYLAKIPQESFAGENKVWISRHDFEELFTGFDLHADQPRYVNIANTVHRIAVLESLSEGWIGVNMHQHQEMNPAITLVQDAEAVMVLPHERKANPIHKIVFHITQDRHHGISQSLSTTTLDLNEIRQALSIKLAQQIVKNQQVLVFSHYTGTYKLTVKSFQAEADSAATPSHAPPSTGLITPGTKMDFHVDKLGNISIVQSVAKENIEGCVFEVTLKRDHLVDDPSPKPIVVTADKLREEIRKLAGSKKIAKGHLFKGKTPFGWNCHFELTDAAFKEEDSVSSNTPYRKAFEISSDTKIDFQWDPEELALTSGTTTNAKDIEFEIEEHAGTVEDKNRKHLKKHWLSYENVIEALRGLNRSFAKDEKFHLTLPSGVYLVSVSAVSAVEGAPEDSEERYKHVYALTEETDISVKASDELEMGIIDHHRTYPLESVKVEITVPSIFFFKSDKKTILPEEELLKAFRKKVGKELVRKQKVKVNVGDEKNLKLTVTGMQVQGGDQPETKFGFCGEITKDTRITFVPDESSDVRVIPKSEKLSIKDPIGKIEEMGVGGLSGQMRTIVRNIFLGRGPMKTQMLKRGISPPRGILFYGPPGTGKTTLARTLSKMLGALGENVQMITAPEIFGKLVGQSEENIRKLFMPAKEAQEKLGTKSPLYVVIIDEIDAIIPKRGDSLNKVNDRVVNQFLGALDGPSQLSNILVIGMTNRLDQLDPAALRSGRLELHIEIGLPEEAARKKIFQIHLKTIEEGGTLASDVDLDQLVHLTAGYSGADIEGVVKRAANYALERLNELDLPEEELDRHPAGMTTQKDLIDALEEVGEKENKRESFHMMYS